jgi:agmatinase
MNFGGAEVVYDYSGSDIIIIPVPYDATSTWIKGADKGPDAILAASVNLEFYDIETRSSVHKRGIYTLPPLAIGDSPEELVNEVFLKTKKILTDAKFPVIIGGNHTVSIGAVKAFSGHYDDLSVLQLDAHADLRQTYEGSPLNHACSMARITEMVPAVQLGIRSMSEDELPYVRDGRIFYSHDLFNDKSLYKKALDILTGNVYITIDLDVFDPSLMPSTGTPEPGGPDYYELMHFLKAVSGEKNIVGFDVVEMCPSPVNKAPDFVAAKVIYQLLSYVFA